MDETTIRIRCQGCGAHTLVTVAAGPQRAVACCECGSKLLEFELIKGFVYVLSHPLMPNLVKIGFTTRQVEERVAELSMATAVPGPFVIEAVFASCEPEQHELTIHKTFVEARVESKEFFRIDLVDAIREIIATCGPPTYMKRPDLLQPAKPRPQSPPPRIPEQKIVKGPRVPPVDPSKRLREWQERMYKK
jgi:T5orf172 domain